MVASRYNSLFFACAFLCGVLCSIPVLAAEGTISIAYRGSGGSYIGDTIVFDGLNTAGNTTVIRISGYGLPAEGVPLYDLNGVPGSGNTVPVDSRNMWFFLWDMSRINTSDLVTSRYTFTAWDRDNPGVVATTSVLLKKPEFSMTATPPAGTSSDYIELEGMAEKGVSYIRLDVTDENGTILHTFITPVGALGFFQHGFRIDMEPGRYYITGSNPSMSTDLTVALTVLEPGTTVTTSPDVTVAVIPADTGAGAEATTAPASPETPVPTTAGNGAAAFAISLAGAGIAAVLSSRK